MAKQNPYPNQKIIDMGYKAPCDRKHPYAMINLEVQQAAVYNLSDVAAGVALYLFLQKNSKDYTENLSNVAFQKYSGFGRRAYDTAVKALIDRGYLVHKGGNRYIFCEIPYKTTADVIVGEKEEPEEPSAICTEETETKTETKTETTTTTTKSKKTYSPPPPIEMTFTPPAPPRKQHELTPEEKLERFKKEWGMI